MGAAMVGNKTTVKCQAAVGLPIEQFMRLLHACGLPKDDIDLISCRGPAMESLIRRAQPRMLQFTGSSQVSEQLNEVVKGRIRCEDSGYDWKVLGPDVSDIEYVAWQCDQDAYANAGQKCSAQSMLVAHSNWMKAGIVERLEKLAARRSLKDLTMGPCLSHTTEEILEHTKNLASLPGARLLFGGKEIEGHQIPKKYGAIVPTAVFVPLKSVMASEENFKAVTVELFGAFQVVTEWGDGEEDLVIAMLERMSHHLTAAVVSKDNHFLQRMLGNTVNGTTYAGLRARTTGAPQNHWFGPAGDSLAAGIGTREAILQTWTCHREIIFDHGPVPSGWTLPPPS
uniref:Aldehyde dehydrogenase domain-containing protein n=1 Tax=Chromera velia CCMP2878 TaxID=1169474 RepID=A0A0G4GJF6_9ALVE|eukprot:Cvel_22176.t1-p1 / transcript=Cvel_22176.t1 / gene=Cvel_22176 / organism=Chromera_velia_CCMP2878 / gene_product=Delta-1-pyrroline-5-carboxylate dehydrogenase 12A1,, putative / transcript_product=Delta-1-pyrroline-5-carboxylate dehydrogenase 12A1,, putative / location=Cvel_scaffold2153:95-4185(+) / protein_length=339 / sequence_SO=supercontig / SO=protein_coding / is_pseudo=false